MDVLAPEAVETATGTYAITQADIDAGVVDNLATVKGTAPGGEMPMDMDPHTQPIPNEDRPASITIDKVTTDGISTGDGITVAAGSAIEWIYKVTNTGVVTLDNVQLEDDQIGSVTNITDKGDGDDFLSPGEMWTFTANGTAQAGDYNNTGIVTADTANPADPRTVLANDPSSYFGADPAIEIEKSTNGEDADNPTGPIILVGDPVTWEYFVENTGNVPFQFGEVTVTDDQGVLPVFDPASDVGSDNVLSVGETWRYFANGIAQEGQYANLGMVEATFSPTGQMATDDDPSHYFGECPPCEFDIFESFSGPDINVTITLEEIDGGVKFTVTETDPNLIGDLRGVFFHVDPDTTDVLTGLTVTGMDVTEYQVEKDSVQDLGNGVNMNGDGNIHQYDVGVEIGTQGIGNDDIQSTMFIVSNPDVELDVENFADVEFGVRLTSVGSEGGNRNQSSKVFGFSPEDCGCELPSVSGFAEPEQPVFG